MPVALSLRATWCWWLSLGKFTECPKEVVMDREVNLEELLQQGLSRRDLSRNAGVAGIGLSALPDLAW